MPVDSMIEWLMLEAQNKGSFFMGLVGTIVYIANMIKRNSIKLLKELEEYRKSQLDHEVEMIDILKEIRDK